MASTPTYLNPSARTYTHPPPPTTHVAAFHRSLPDYAPTRLHTLPSLAASLSLAAVLVKDESTRFALPAFKITGASWAIHRALCSSLSLPITTPLSTVGDAAKKAGVRLVTCTEGNWGRATARMARYLGVGCTVFVPRFMVRATERLIEGEGADVVRIEGDYDESVRRAEAEVRERGGLLVMDVAWEGYEEVPKWVVEGYSTILQETDEQLDELVGRPATHVFAPIGVGSWGQAVTEHYKSEGRPSALVTAVEPDTAACLKTSLEAGKIVSVETGESIMAGMNCGTVSLTAWPSLQKGADAAITVTDKESHEAVQYLHERGIMSGPCGASTLAALRKMKKEGHLGLNEDSVVVLFSTEGAREYETPV